MTRISAIAAALMLTVGGPAGAQQMMRMLERGPVGYLHGHTLLQAAGDLTAGDFSHPAAADWDGDGRLDLIAGSGYGDLLFFRGTATGLFEPAQALIPESEVRLDAAPERRQVSPWVGDLDADGMLDLLLGIDDRIYRYRVSDGAPGGGVALVGGGDLPQAPGPLSPCVLDCDGDGTLDLVLADGRGRLLWLPLTGEPGTGLRALTAGGAPITAPPPVRICAADWDGDGRSDLLVGDAPGAVALYLGTADGLVHAEALGGGETRWIPGGIAAREVAPWAVDWDADGDMDLLLGCRRGFVLLVERLEPGRLRLAGYLQQSLAPVDAGRCAVAAPGDWDGDGDIDLVVGGEDGYLTMFERLPGSGITLGRGKRVVAEGSLVRAEEGAEPELCYAAPALADWDADGDADLLVGCGSGAVLVWQNSGGLHPLGPLRVGGSRLAVDGIAMPAPHDANGDGDTDLFLGARETPRDAVDAGEAAPPHFAPAVAYFENIANRTGVLPQFAKGVPLAMTLVSPGEPPLLRDADFLAPYATWPAPWDGPRVDFITATIYGTFAFTNTARPGAYARLQLDCAGRSLPPPLLPELFFARPVEMIPGEVGLLAADEAYGFVCYYPRALFPR